MKERSAHVLATVLFTDIVDSSTLARELGDARWHVLLARHHLIVRRAIRRYHGREVDNAGDGFFIAFRDQVAAIRCACAISNEVRQLGIQVRAGCHVGQAEVVGRKLGGITIHTASRVMAEARAGEVLVSSTMKDLVPASGFGFVDRGERTLKGIDGTWHLYAVAAVDGEERPPPLDPIEAARLRGAIEPPALRERRWVRVAAVASVLVAAAVGTVIIVNRPKPVAIVPESVVRIDPVSEHVIADVPVAQPEAGQMAMVPPNEVWSLSHKQQVISVIDVDSDSAEAPIPIGGGAAGSESSGFGMVYAFGSVWVAPINEEAIEAIDPQTGVANPDRRIPVPGTTGRLATDDTKALWVPVLEHDGWHIRSVSPDGIRLCDRKTNPLGYNVGVGEGSVWVSNGAGLSVTKVDPDTCEGTRIPLPGINGAPSGVGIGFGSVWLSNAESGVVYRIDPATEKVIGTITIGDLGTGYQSDIVMLGDSMWVTDPGGRAIDRIDPNTDQVRDRIPLPYAPQDLVAAYGSLWATVTRFPCCSF
jgi:class 3 adenylate cyclase/streptogramin lyase